MRIPASVFLLLAAVGLAACGADVPAGVPHCPGVSAELAVPPPPALDRDAAGVSLPSLRAWVDLLAAPELKGRHATSDEGRAAAALLARHMAALGLVAPFPHSGYCQAVPQPEKAAYNVVGHLAAAGGPRQRRAVLIGAHFDGQGLHPLGFVYPSADDNASGVAALVETARLAARKSWPFDLVFVAFTAEEVGQVGAEVWVRKPTVPLAEVLLMINFDMVGRPWPGSPPEAIGYLARGTGPDKTAARIAAASAASGIAIRRLEELFREDDLRSDSTVLGRYVPTLYLSTGLHADHHQVTDTPGRVDVEQTGRAVRLALAVLDNLAHSEIGDRL